MYFCNRRRPHCKQEFGCLAGHELPDVFSSPKKQHGVYHFISKDSLSRKAFYVWRYDPKNKLCNALFPTQDWAFRETLVHEIRGEACIL